LIGIIFGPPGSGKGTQAARIEAEFKLKHLSTGQILRAEVARGTPIGKEAGRIMAAGDRVRDELIVTSSAAACLKPRRAPGCSWTASRARSARPRPSTPCWRTRATPSTS